MDIEKDGVLGFVRFMGSVRVVDGKECREMYGIREFEFKGMY